MSEECERGLAILLIVFLGTACPGLLYLNGFQVWALFSLGFIPFVLGCWGLSLVLPDSRVREIARNLTPHERRQLREMARAYGRRMVFRFLPVFVLLAVLVPGTVLLHSRGIDRLEEYLLGHQWVILEVVGTVVLIMVLISLPSMRKQYRATTAFLMKTEYSRQMGYSSPNERSAMPS
jgi:hypothetical protein